MTSRWMESHYKELVNEEPEQIISFQDSENDDDAEEDESAKPILITKAVSDFLCKVDKLAEIGVDMDPIMERSLTLALSNF
jgi:hypothetical protein